MANSIEVKVDLVNDKAEQVHLGKELPFETIDPRGGSQVVTYGDYRVAITHSVDPWKSEKGDRDGHYNHRMIVWDKDWNLAKISKKFSFLNTNIEFCCGMTYFDNHFLITAGIQDNAAILLKVPGDALREFVYE